MVIPLIYKGNPIGLATLDSHQLNRYTKEDAEFGFAIANQAAIAIGNARLYQEALRASERRAVLHRMDIYQLGVLLYRLTCGAYPRTAASLDALRTAHSSCEAVRLRDRRADLPACFVQVVECALEAEPTRRFQSMGEMERALRATLGSSRPVRSCARRRMQAGAALLVLAAALVPSPAPQATHETPALGPSSQEYVATLFVFMLATFIGFEVIRNVSRLLHTPLMSLTNAISAIAAHAHARGA